VIALLIQYIHIISRICSLNCSIMAAYVFAPIVSGVDNLRMNAMFGGEHPTVDLYTNEKVVPARFSGSLILAPAYQVMY
jgi:hypothetical protein